jgi:hypothetical protein
MKVVSRRCRESGLSAGERGELLSGMDLVDPRICICRAGGDGSSSGGSGTPSERRMTDDKGSMRNEHGELEMEPARGELMPARGERARRASSLDGSVGPAPSLFWRRLCARCLSRCSLTIARHEPLNARDETLAAAILRAPRSSRTASDAV